MSNKKKKSLLLSIVDYVKKANEEICLSEEQIRENLDSEREFWNFVADRDAINYKAERKNFNKKEVKVLTEEEKTKYVEELWKCLDDPEHIDRNNYQKRK